MSNDKIGTLRIPAGPFYGPCSGQDMQIAFELFGDVVDRFVFCDLTYGNARVSARCHVPDGWTLISRVCGREEGRVANVVEIAEQRAPGM